MSASSSAASSTLTRSKAAILVFTSLAAAYLIYYHQRDLFIDLENSASTSLSTGLHRSNAVHRRRRRARTNEESDREAAQERDYESAAAEDANNILGPLGDGETVVDEIGPSEFGGWSAGEPPPAQRNGQNIVQLLFRVSEDATRRNAYVHRGCQCNSCGTVPIRGIRYRCSNCADFDLCEACEAQGPHTKTHVFYKVRVPTSSFSTRQMQPVWYPGEPDTCVKSLPRDLISKLSKETGFDRPELDAYWEQWTFMANSEWREDPDELCLAMDRKTFDQCFVPSGGNRHATPNLIHDRMFAFYDTNHDDLISFPEFLNGLAYRRRKDKLKKVFEGYDINGDGYVDRRDFLRIFRSYYVLYKQMHRDLLEGLDDQVMNSSEAHQLVTSRQPLSSAFGRDGRFPSAPDPRSGEGKAPGVTGDLEITDGKGVITESGNDLGNREEVIVDAIVREYPRWLQQAPSWGVTGGNTYWRALANPPETIDALQHDVIEGLIRDRRRVLQDGTRVGHYQNSLTDTGSAVDDDDDDDDDDGDDDVEEDINGEGAQEKWPPDFVTVTDVEAVCGEGISVAETPHWRRKEVISTALHRLREDAEDRDTRAVKEELHERWKRRQFYTDEEEGAVAPPDWKEEDDIPYQITKAVEFKDSVPPSRPISPRSRSSSKVRFAEDTDDYEIRSNPSTSSRSVPERWGGMEIPDAEKDAGKEILYQVTQQAYNELLDQLFKKQEDIAVKALSSKKVRSKHQHLFTNPLFEEWSLLLDKDLKKSKKKLVSVRHEPKEGEKEPMIIPGVEIPNVRQRSLDELLAASGYTVNPGTEAVDHAVSAANEPSEDRGAIVSSISHENRDSIHSSSGVSAGSWVNITDTAASERARNSIEPARRPSNVSTQPPVVDGVAHENTPAPTELREAGDRRPPHQGTSRQYRDPTLPQFRPNYISSQDSLRTHTASTIIETGERALTNAVQTLEDQDRSAWADEPAGDPEPTMATENRPGPSGDNPATSEPPLCARRAQVLQLFKSSTKDQVRSPSPVEFERTHIEAAKERALSSMTEEQRKEFEGLDWKMLYDLREMEGWEEQAIARGGWGRLSYEEFEQMLKGEDAEPMSENARRAMMEYLGSWIDICIP